MRPPVECRPRRYHQGVVISSVLKPTPAPPSHIGSTASLQVPSRPLSHSEVLLLVINSKLEEVAPSIDTPHLSSPGLQLRELAPTFARIRQKEDLATVVKEIFSFATTDQERASLVSFTLPSLIRLCTIENKKHLLGLALKEPKRNLRKRLCYGVLRSAANREELLTLLSPVKARLLVECGSRKLTEIVAKALVLKALEPLTVPTPMWEPRFKENNVKNRRTARSRAQELASAARKGLEALEKLDFLSHKPRLKSETRPLIPARPLHDARMTLGWIVKSSEKLRPGQQPTYGRLREFVNTASRRLAMERSDGIRLLQSHTLPDKDLWKPRLVERLTSAFHLVPEAERIMTPQLREFTLSSLKDGRNAAQRCTHGRIAFDYPGQLFRGPDNRYDGASSLTMLVLHEVAHSIQMGHEGRTIQWDYASGELYSPNNPLIDLKGFLEISGWRVLGYLETSAFIREIAVRIGDKLYPLGRPVQIELPLQPNATTAGTPHTVVLRRSGNMLYCHRPDARFSLDNYALTDPMEDWAEAFTEYIICPDRLIDLAPEKFHYMEIHFRAYRTARDFTRLNALHRALAELRSAKGSESTNTPKDPPHIQTPQPEQTEFSFTP